MPPREPAPPARFNRVFVWFDHQFAKLDGLLGRWIPPELNPIAVSGRAANFAILVAVVTGILMLFWYVPSHQAAYSSLESTKGRTLGGWMRAMHRYSSDLILLLILVHAGRTFFARKFNGSRWLPWVSGIFLLLLIWFIGWTGYWLVWDQPAQQVAITSMRFLDAVPIFGEPMSRLFAANRLIPSLLFFVVFFLHMLLPLLIAVGLIFHLARLSRVRLLPGKALCLIMLGALAIASIILPAPLDAPADMTVKVEHLTVDAWYLTPLSIGLRLSDPGLWLAAGITLLFAFTVPWTIGCRHPVRTSDEKSEPVSPIQTYVTASRCNACTQCYQDCPYDAISMLSREDDRPFHARAWVDPARCVGCAVCVGSCDSEAMNLPWFDLRTEEKRILESLRDKWKETPDTSVALIAADIDGGLSHFKQKAWEKRLPGYSVHGVPTASWIRPRLIEKILKVGAPGVLIVRDNRIESAARDGNLWLEMRLQGAREPNFRPKRVGENAHAWKIVPYNPGHPQELTRIAKAFRQDTPKATTTLPPSASGKTAIIAAILLTAILTMVTVAPSHLKVTNPDNPKPELLLSFKAFGEQMNPEDDEIENDESRPVHMRGRSTVRPTRHPVTIQIFIDGKLHEREYQAKGLSKDGPAIDQWRIFIPSGDFELNVNIIPGPGSEMKSWSGMIHARDRRRSVLIYDPREGFLAESGLTSR